VTRFALVTFALAACTPTPRVPVTVVVRGDATEVARVNAALAKSPPENVEVRTVVLDAPLVVDENVAARAEPLLEKVRAAYDEPSWQKCIAPIDDPALVPSLLASGARDAAARVLFWRTACLLLKGDEAAARVAARDLAARGLDVPTEKSDPAVPRLLHEVTLEASREPASVVRVVSAGPELTVDADGHRAVCTTPCPVPARPGTHTVRVEGDGRMPESREVVVVASAPVVASFDPPLAPPDLSARQWVTRWSSSPSVDAATSLHLLAEATRARNLVLIVAHGGARPDVRAALAVDGVVRSRAEKDGARGDAAPNIVHELLVSGHVVESGSVFKKPLFWIAVVAAAGLGAGLTYYLATLPHTATVHP
jgi:hypothetical protein